MHASKWPFGDRPTTNTLIQVMIAMVIGGVFIMFPGPVVAIALTVVGLRGARGVYRALRQEWFPPKPAWMVIGADGTKRLDETDGGKLWQIVGIKNRCPDCDGEGFFTGPSGGMSTNIICRNGACRSKFNITDFGGGAGTVDRIGRDPISALDSYPPESFGKDLTPDQLVAAKAKIVAEEAAKSAAIIGSPSPECGTCHAPLDATGLCPNN